MDLWASGLPLLQTNSVPHPTIKAVTSEPIPPLPIAADSGWLSTPALANDIFHLAFCVAQDIAKILRSELVTEQPLLWTRLLGEEHLLVEYSTSVVRHPAFLSVEKYAQLALQMN